jgi:hypothetical protein
MSLIHTLTAIIKDRGPSDVDELLPNFPAHTRYQVIIGLRNAAARDWIHCSAKIKTGTRGANKAIYSYGPKPKAQEPERQPEPRCRTAHVLDSWLRVNL